MGILEDMQAQINANNVLLKDIDTKVTALGSGTVPTPVPVPTPLPTPIPSSHSFGFTANSFQSLNGSDQALWLTDMKAIGMSWLRFDANWHNIGSSNWGQLDAAVNACSGAGMSVCLILDGNGQGNMWQPPDPAAFASFCTTVVNRYKGKGVHTYEVWNEPNNTTFWSTGVSPAQYTAVLRAAYAAIHVADAAAIVLGGGMCPCAMNPIPFLQGMYAAGAHGFFDALSLHPYTYPAAPDNGIRWQEMNSTNPSIRSVMTSNGDSALKIWITEMGAPTATPVANGVTEATQATQLAQAITDVKSYPWAANLFLYSYKDNNTGSSNNEDNFGLVRSDGSHKPSYASVKIAIAA